jgi:NAD(P)-dependent dehydrogenase (short-subunit alcohol dehydrogenase family)
VKDLVVVITGAARGIGRAAAERFREQGATVVAVDRSWDGADPIDAVAETVDITDTAAVLACRDRTVERFGRVDFLVNNAARRQRDLYPPEGIVSVLETTQADWDAMVGVNLTGTLNMIRAFVEPMLAQRRGSIANVGTRGSVMLPVRPGVWRHSHPEFRNQPYDASKAALCSASMYLAEELREHGVAVNVVFPGPTFTTGSEAIVEARRAAGIDARPFLRPDHLAPLLLHLARQDGTGDTGLAIDAVRWNEDNGHGDASRWRHAGV